MTMNQFNTVLSQERTGYPRIACQSVGGAAGVAELGVLATILLMPQHPIG